MASRTAVIVVGSHHAGKSKTIREFLKPMLGIGKSAHIFSLDKREGHIASQSREEATWQRNAKGRVDSQSLEEAGRKDVARTVRRHTHYDLRIMAARPQGEEGSLLNRLREALEDENYRVNVINVTARQSESEYEASAAEILRHLRN